MLRKNSKIVELFDSFEGYLYNDKIFIELTGSVITQIIYKPGTTLGEIKSALFEVEKIENFSGIPINEIQLPVELLLDKVYETTNCESYEADFEIIDLGECCTEENDRTPLLPQVEIGGTTQDKYLTYLQNIGVSASIIKWALEYRRHNLERLENAPDIVKDLVPDLEIMWIGKPKFLEKCLISMMLRQPLNLKGDAATGKTTLVKTIAEILYLPIYIVNGSVEAKKSTLVGEFTVEDSEMKVQRGQLTLAMDKNYFGGMLYIDEVNMLKADVLSLINPVTDGSKYFYNDIEKINIYAHDDFHFVTAMNFSNYAGTKKLNTATFDRTAAIILKNPDKKTIKELITQHSNRINKTLRKNQFKEIDAYDIANLTDIYVQIVNSRLSAEAKSFRNILLMLNYITTIGYANALEMWLDKIQNDADRAKVVGILSQNDLLNRLRVTPTEIM